MSSTVRLLVCALTLLIIVSPASAQPPSHGWVSVDSAWSRPTQGAHVSSASQPMFQEQATATATYPPPKTTRFVAFEGGVIAWRGLGAGLRFGSVSRTTTVPVVASIPSPVFFDRHATVTQSATVAHDERTLDVMGAYVLPVPAWVGIRVFGGASFVELQQGYVSKVAYFRDLGQPFSVDTMEERTRTWGTHVGVDLAVYPQKNVGIGLNLLRRQVEIPTQRDPLSGGSFVVAADQTTIGIGARLRF